MLYMYLLCLDYPMGSAKESIGYDRYVPRLDVARYENRIHENLVLGK